MINDPFSPYADPYPPKSEAFAKVNRRDAQKLMVLSTMAAICGGCAHSSNDDTRMPKNGYTCDAPFCRYSKRGAPPV